MALHYSDSSIHDGTNDIIKLDAAVNQEAVLTDRQVAFKGAIVHQNDGIQAITDHGASTSYYRRLSIANQGYTGSPSHTTVYHWYTFKGIGVPSSGGMPPYLELRVMGHSGHAGGSRIRLIGLTFTSYGTTLSGGMTASTAINAASPAPAYPNTLNCYFYGNDGGNNQMYMKVEQAMREPYISVWADLYTVNAGGHIHRDFDMLYHGQSTSQSQTEPADADSGTLRTSST